MKYDTTYSRETVDAARSLIESLATDDVVIDITGVPLDDADRERWATAAAHADLVRQHAAVMSRVHSIDDLTAAGRAVAREHLRGQWVIGVQYSTEGTPQIHIAQAGSEADCLMADGDIDRFRRALAEFLGESIGGEPA